MAQEVKSFNQVLNGRRSIRAFRNNAEVDATKLHKILIICEMAPSSGGLQTFEIYQIKNENLKRRLVGASNDQTFIFEAPLVLVFCANPSRSVQRFGERSKLFSVQDATIAAAYAQLAVCALGLSTVWVGALDEEKISAILNLEQLQDWLNLE
jgi:nitroreductase